MMYARLYTTILSNILGRVARGSRYRDVARIVKASGWLLHRRPSFLLNSSTLNSEGERFLSAYALAVASGFTHTDIEGEFRQVGSGHTLCLRVTDHANHYRFTWAEGEYRFSKVVAGVETMLASVTAAAPFPHRAVSFSLTGTTFEAQLHGKTLTATDATYTTGELGVYGTRSGLFIK